MKDDIKLDDGTVIIKASDVAPVEDLEQAAREFLDADAEWFGRNTYWTGVAPEVSVILKWMSDFAASQIAIARREAVEEFVEKVIQEPLDHRTVDFLYFTAKEMKDA